MGVVAVVAWALDGWGESISTFAGQVDDGNRALMNPAVRDVGAPWNYCADLDAYLGR